MNTLDIALMNWHGNEIEEAYQHCRAGLKIEQLKKP